MDSDNIIKNRFEKLNELKLLLSNVDNKLLHLTRELNWDHTKLLEESKSNMVTCSINPQHRVPSTKIKIHEQKCILHHQGYSDKETFFPEHSGAGSFISLTSETLYSITQNVPPSTVHLNAFIMMELKSNHILLPTSTRNVMVLCQSSYNSGKKKWLNFSKLGGRIVSSVVLGGLVSGNKVRDVPQTSANFDQNFNREEKLAIYDYVIANTKKQKSYSDLWLQPTEKSEEKREMTAWEIAAAERDAKRRRASYRNKVHTNRKTHTEILREVIESQMEVFKEERNEKTNVEVEGPKASHKKSSHESRDSDKHKSRYHEGSGRGSKEDRDRGRNHEKHSKHRDHKRSPPDTGSDIKSRSRSHDKYRKWKSYEGRSHSHRSSHTHRR